MKRGWKSPKIGSMYYTEELQDEFSFFERIPVDLYQFSYLPEEDEETHFGMVLVYDCMQKAYQEWMQCAWRVDSP